MKTISKYLALVMLILALVVTACKKDEQTSVGFSMKATGTSAPDQASKQPIVGTEIQEQLALKWDVAWMYITQLEFNARYNSFSTEDDNEKHPDIHLVWQGNQKVNLLEEPKIFADLELENGLYDEISLQLTSSRITGTYGPNFYLSGMFGPVLGGTPIAVSVTKSFKMMMKFEDWTINTEKDEFYNGLIEISLNHVFNGITTAELAMAERFDGWILIDAMHNTGLYARILANLQVDSEDGLHWDAKIINP